MQPLTRPALPLLAAVLMVWSPALAAQPPRIRDSAGVRIVENRARSGAPMAFTLAASPSTDLGGLQSNPDDEFAPRFYGFNVVAFPDGGRVVGDWHRVMFFDGSGKLLKVVGREGQGPREFQVVGSVCRTRGDTIVVHDAGNMRVSILDRLGNFVREFSVGRIDQLRGGCFDDGTFLMRAWVSVPGSGSAVRLTRWRIDGSQVADLGVFGGAPAFNRYLATQASVSAHGKHFVVSDPRSSEVRMYDVDGRLVRIIRTDDPIARLTASESDALQSFGAAGTSGGAPPGRTTQPAAPPKPTEWPAYGSVVLDLGGRVWIQDYKKRSSDPYFWTAFDPEGRMLGRFRMDPALKSADPIILSFTASGVVIRREDSDGAVHLSTYGLMPVQR